MLPQLMITVAFFCKNRDLIKKAFNLLFMGGTVRVDISAFFQFGIFTAQRMDFFA